MPGHYVRRLQQLAVRLFAQHVAHDITPVQFAALVAADEHPRLDQGRLSALIGYDRATIGGVIDRLEAKGWIERTPSAADRRANIVAITRTGRQRLQAVLPGVRSAQEAMLVALTPAERRRFKQLCNKVLRSHSGS